MVFSLSLGYNTSFQLEPQEINKSLRAAFDLSLVIFGSCTSRQIGKAVKDTDLAVMQLRGGWNVRLPRETIF
jgi:hypothetical protein